MLYLHKGYCLPSLVRFRQLIEPIKMTYFKNLFFSESRKLSQISVSNTNFFPSRAKSKLRFVWHSSNAGDNTYQVCFDLHNSLTRWKRPFFKIRYSRNSKISVWNNNFFPRQPIPKISFSYALPTQKFLFPMLYLHSFFLGKLDQKFFFSYALPTRTEFGYCVPSLVRFRQLLDPIKMTYF